MIPDSLDQTADCAVEQVGMAAKWKAASTRWAREIKISYLANPATRRDFKVQYRGNRAGALFGLVILGMAGVTLYFYYMLIRQGLGLEDLQSQLLNFCAIMFAILGVAVTLMAPALAATSLMGEKTQKSLDLVFVSPMRPAAYLMGKLIASYRFIWVLMALSFPFTAVTIILGGGAWGNVVECYLLLSLHALVFSAIGIYFASVIQKGLSALIYTYGTVFASVVGTSWLYALVDRGGSSSPFLGGPASFTAALSPLLVEFAAGTTTSVLGIAVPNVVIAGAFTLVLVQYLVQCAAAKLSVLTERSRAGIRLQTAALLALGSGLLANAAMSSMPVNQPHPLDSLVFVAVLPLMPLFLFMPFLACYGSDADQRETHAGLFKVRDILGRSVAGALPFVVLLTFASIVGTGLGLASAGVHVYTALGSGLAYAIGLLTFCWASARFSSSFNHGLRASRIFQFVSIATVVGAPLPLFLWASMGTFSHDLWKWFILAPFMGQFDEIVSPLQGLLLGIAGVGVALWSERNLRKGRQRQTLEEMGSTPVVSSGLSSRLGTSVVSTPTVETLSQQI